MRPRSGNLACGSPLRLQGAPTASGVASAPFEEGREAGEFGSRSAVPGPGQEPVDGATEGAAAYAASSSVVRAAAARRCESVASAAAWATISEAAGASQDPYLSKLPSPAHERSHRHHRSRP